MTEVLPPRKRSKTDGESPPALLSGPPTTRAVLGVLTKARLSQFARSFGVSLQPKWSKDEQIEALVRGTALPFQPGFRSLRERRA